ncbi:sugar ABC transporter permease [Candidatus Aerophobetes bacterium]|nr:sugar ABC transporter permease [Candidatus Aerophobetes bacterium]
MDMHTKKIRDKASWWIDKHFGLLLILPCVIVLMGMVIGPLIYTFHLSFHSWFISAVTPPKWVGITNFARIPTDQGLIRSLRVTAYFTFISLALQIGVGVGLAQLLNRDFEVRRIVRSILILPLASTPVAISLNWRLMLHPVLGIINYFLNVFGIKGQLWLTHPDMVMFSIIMIDVWQWTPLIMLIVLAGMTSVDPGFYEAAIIDGASGLQRFWHITLPLIRPAVIVASMLRFMDSIKTFDMIYVTTQGGPGWASRILNLYVFEQGFRYFHMGYASSLVVFVTSLIMGTSLLMIRFRRSSL